MVIGNDTGASLDALNRLNLISRKAAGTAAAAEAHRSTASLGNGRKLNIADVPFKVVIEAVGLSQSNMARKLPPGWTTNSDGDCSHGFLQYQGHYIKLISPELRHGDAAFASIREALDNVKNAGARLGNTGAMKILLRNNSFDVETVKELYRMHQSIEPIAYNVGQNGTGYHVGHNTINYKPGGWSRQWGSRTGNFYFCMPVSNIPDLNAKLAGANSLYDIAGVLSSADRYRYGGHHWGFLPRSPKIDAGYAEFRYFTGTLDADAVRADVEMLLGMVKAAHEGRWPKDLPAQPLSRFEQRPIDQRVYSAFMREVMGGMPTAAKVQELFNKAGGKVDCPAVTADDIARLSQLQKSGFSFDWGAKELSSIVGGGKTVKITEPGQAFSYEVPGKQFLHFLSVEAGGAPPLDPQTRSMAGTVGDLRRQGVKFFASTEEGAGHPPLTSMHGTHAALTAGRLAAEVDGQRIPLADRDAFERFAFERLSGDAPAVVREATAAALELAGMGYAFSDAGGQSKVDTPLSILRHLQNGGVAMASAQGAAQKFASSEALLSFVSERKQQLSALPPSTAQAFQRLEALQKGSDVRVSSGKTTLSPHQIAWMLHDKRGLDIGPADGGASLRVADLPSFETAMAIEARATSELPQSTQRILAGLDRLSEQNVRFYSNNAPAALQSLQVQKLGERGLRLELPSRIRWGVLWRRSITPSTAAHLEKIANRLG